MFELFSYIYFVVYKLYYVGQNNNLGIRVSLKNWDRGSSTLSICDSPFTLSKCLGARARAGSCMRVHSPSLFSSLTSN
jgi:hypothetical protein